MDISQLSSRKQHLIFLVYLPTVLFSIAWVFLIPRFYIQVLEYISIAIFLSFFFFHQNHRLGPERCICSNGSWWFMMMINQIMFVDIMTFMADTFNHCKPFYAHVDLSYTSLSLFFPWTWVALMSSIIGMLLYQHHTIPAPSRYLSFLLPSWKYAGMSINLIMRQTNFVFLALFMSAIMLKSLYYLSSLCGFQLRMHLTLSGFIWFSLTGMLVSSHVLRLVRWCCIKNVSWLVTLLFLCFSLCCFTACYQMLMTSSPPIYQTQMSWNLIDSIPFCGTWILWLSLIPIMATHFAYLSRGRTLGEIYAVHLLFPAVLSIMSLDITALTGPLTIPSLLMFLWILSASHMKPLFLGNDYLFGQKDCKKRSEAIPIKGFFSLSFYLLSMALMLNKQWVWCLAYVMMIPTLVLILLAHVHLLPIRNSLFVNGVV